MDLEKGNMCRLTDKKTGEWTEYIERDEFLYSPFESKLKLIPTFSTHPFRQLNPFPAF